MITYGLITLVINLTHFGISITCFFMPLYVLSNRNINMCLPEEIAKSIQEVGLKETMEIMGRSMAFIASKLNEDMEFDCDIATVNIELKNIKVNS